MPAKRIIPCLDLKDGRVVKGVNFVDLRDAGDPIELVQLYAAEGADEIVLLDITATAESRGTMVDVVRRICSAVSAPVTVGGGIRSIEDALAILDAGASKISIGSAAVKTPMLISEAAQKYGGAAVVVAIDARENAAMPSGYEVYIAGGRKATGLDAVLWATEVGVRGAGEILLTSMDRDGTKAGFDLALTRAVCEAASIPVTASGGCGALEHFSDLFQQTGAAAALAAGLFHFGELRIGQVKDYLRAKGIATY